MYQIKVGLFFTFGLFFSYSRFFSMFHHDFVPEFYLIPKKYEENL